MNLRDAEWMEMWIKGCVVELVKMMEFLESRWYFMWRTWY